MMKRLLQKLREDIRGFGFKQWFLIILNAALVLAAAASLAGLRMVAGTLESLTAAERFQGDGELRYAQIACYLPVGDGKTEDDIYTFHQSLESRLVEQSLKAAENGRLYLDAYCGTGKVRLVMMSTKLPLASSRRALLGTMVSKVSLLCPMERLILVPASISPETRKTRSFFCPGAEGSAVMASSTAETSLPQR